MGWYDTLAQVHHVRYFYRDMAGETLEIHLPLRMYYPQELRALIDLAGWRTVQEWEDFDGTPLDQTSLKWVMVLQPA
jgi:hypothetical protein